MKRVLQFVIVLGLLCSMASPQAGPASAIAKAYGNGVETSQVDLPAGASLPCEASQVRITGLRRISAETSQVTAKCATGNALPVVAWVRSPLPPRMSPSALAPIAKKKSAEPLLVRAGARMRLELTKADMLITMQVVCLGSGRAGDTIRVMDTTGRLRYSATVISAGLLRGEFR